MAKLTPLQIGKMKAAQKFIELAAEGARIKKVSEDEQQRRIGLCEACPKFDPKYRACTLCNCPMDYKTNLKHDPIRVIKDKFKINKEVGGTETSCPIDKW